MSNLYGQALSKVFDKVYQGFVDYKAEYLFYADLCQANNVKSILELGCGTGNLAINFSKNFQEYLGLDYSQHMLSLAREKFPNGNFIQGDMRNFNLDKKFDIALITGRSTSYLLTSDDILNTFKCIHTVLNRKGYLIFDCIDATRFIPYITENPRVIHQCMFEDIHYSRTSEWYVEEKDQNIINWTSNYFRLDGSKQNLLGNDTVSFKVYTKSAIKSTLNIAGFEILKIIDRTTYAFDTFVIVAKKTK
ncbi:class I SAM-dependent methyltransferase [Flavobacteriaceae bacterium KMM 6898]|nr:class I SAM-dependent methyltransferase [Flavobacteriaceae bacterium KMM 6898]